MIAQSIDVAEIVEDDGIGSLTPAALPFVDIVDFVEIFCFQAEVVYLGYLTFLGFFARTFVLYELSKPEVFSNFAIKI